MLAACTQTMAAPFEEWYSSVPPVTKWFMTLCFATTLAVFLDLVSPLHLYLNFDLIWWSGEWWRLVSNLFFFDYFSLNFLFHMYFLVRHSRMLEEGSFRGRTADYLWLWMFGALMLSAIDFAFYWFSEQYTWLPEKVMFLAPSLVFVVVYVWSRRNPNVMMSFLGLFTFTAPYLPWVILGFGMLLGQPPLHDFLGIIVGHIYFFLEDVYRAQTGRRLIRTPPPLTWLVAKLQGNRPAPPAPGVGVRLG